MGEGEKPNTTKVLRADGKEKLVPNDKVDKQNPPKYELLEDLANMTYLSEVKWSFNFLQAFEITLAGKRSRINFLQVQSFFNFRRFNFFRV